MTNVLSTSSDLADRARLDLEEFWAADEEYLWDVFAQMRREDPVFWCEPGRFWVISKWHDQRFVGSNPQLFTSTQGFLLQDNFDSVAVAPQMPAWAQEHLLSGQLTPAEARYWIAKGKMSMGDPTLEHVIILDPPRHGIYRKALTRALSQRAIRQMDELVASVTDDALNAIAPDTTEDFVQSVAARIPASLMAALMGIPEGEGRERFFRGSTAFMESFNLTPESDPARVERLMRLSEDFVAYQAELIEERTRTPGDDMVSRIVMSEIDGERISPTIGMMFTMSLITGGSDTTKHMMSHIARAFAKFPDQREIVSRRPELIPGAVDEVLRYYTVAWHGCRTATQDVEIRDKTIRKGDFVVLAYPSSNRDEDVFDNVDDFDVTRHFDASNQAFGWGEHLCPGAALSRLEGQLMLRGMLRRFPNWDVLDDSDRFTSYHQNGYNALEVRFAA
jgi:cytochrome P450